MAFWTAPEFCMGELLIANIYVGKPQFTILSNPAWRRFVPQSPLGASPLTSSLSAFNSTPASLLLAPALRPQLWQPPGGVRGRRRGVVWRGLVARRANIAQGTLHLPRVSLLCSSGMFYLPHPRSCVNTSSVKNIFAFSLPTSLIVTPVLANVT